MATRGRAMRFTRFDGVQEREPRDQADGAQGSSAKLFDASGPIPMRQMKRKYLNFTATHEEHVNLAYAGHTRSPEHERQYRRLRRKLARVERTRLQPLA